MRVAPFSDRDSDALAVVAESLRTLVSLFTPTPTQYAPLDRIAEAGEQIAGALDGIDESLRRIAKVMDPEGEE